tara:strand:- start:110 stop:454 length:345 start_codon:yes stop_codon:yes gene_type:complete
MSSGQLVAGAFVEIVDSKTYPVLEALTYVEENGVCSIVEDVALIKQMELNNAKDVALKHADQRLTYWGDIVEFAQGSKQEAALAMTKSWREYRYNVTHAKELPLPEMPKEQSDE